jgi:cytidine deaminase
LPGSDARSRRRARQPAVHAAGARAGASGLIDAARQARLRSLADFSGFAVGAALETSTGDIVTGCNIENATYGLTMCAERVALFKALSEGHRRFEAIAVSASAPRPTPPCGSCRQLLWEYCGDIPVIMAGTTGDISRTTLARLFPEPFGPGNLEMKK